MVKNVNTNTKTTENKKSNKKKFGIIIALVMVIGMTIVASACMVPDRDNMTVAEAETTINTSEDVSTEETTEATSETTTEVVTSEATTEAPVVGSTNDSTEVPTTEETTEAPTTEVPTTEAPTTEAPSTEDTEETPVHTCSYTVVENVAPTCTTDGYVKEQCSCGKTRTTTTDAHGHSWVTTTETIHHDEVGEYVTYVVFSDGYEMVYTGKDAINDYIKKCGSEKGYIPSYNKVDRWVVTQEAYDEVITTTTCSHCGCPQ